MGGNIPGGNSPGGSLMAGSFPGGIFPEPIFISTMKTSYLPHKNTVSKNEILNQKQIAIFFTNIRPKLFCKIPEPLNKFENYLEEIIQGYQTNQFLSMNQNKLFFL